MSPCFAPNPCRSPGICRLRGVFPRAGLGLATLTLALLVVGFVALPAPALADPHKVTISPAGSLLLPEGWRVMDPGLAAKQISETKEKLNIAISSNTAFFAVKNNATMDWIAIIALERTQASPLNNNIIPLLTPEEKEEVYANMRLVMTGIFKMAEAPVEITETTFKTFGRYHALIMSMRQAREGTPLETHVIYYVLPKETHILTVVYRADAGKELNPDFSVIMDSFDPDSSYQPEPPPARKEGEVLYDYLDRIYSSAEGAEAGKEAEKSTGTEAEPGARPGARPGAGTGAGPEAGTRAGPAPEKGQNAGKNDGQTQNQ